MVWTLVDRRQRVGRRGLTLIEMLVVVAVTLIFMFALTQVFALLGDGVLSGRAVIEMNNHLRAVTLHLQHDLDHVTVTTLPWTHPQSATGYFEYIEGPFNDNRLLSPDPNDSRFGDFDDILMLTVRAKDSPFVGRIAPGFTLDPIRSTVTNEIESYLLLPSTDPNAPATVIESEFAEVILWTTFDDKDSDGVPDANEQLTLHRRVLLVRPDIDLRNGGIPTGPAFFRGFDISARTERFNGAPQMIANSLADLSKRENRYAHPYDPTDTFSAFLFPHELDPNSLKRQDPNSPLPAYRPFDSNEPRFGEDVLMGNLLAFDVRVYDPFAPIQTTGNDDALVPGDPGWGSAGTTQIGSGAYVDLGYIDPNQPFGFNPNQPFGFGPHRRSRLLRPTFDTWSFHYEHDGIDNDFDSPTTIDEGVDGEDTDGANGVDDLAERETSPPYPIPLRGLQVTIRVYEPDSQTVRQVVVTANFVPE